MDRRKLLTLLPVPLVGMAFPKKEWKSITDIETRREQLIIEIGRRDLRDIAEILADIILRIESLEEP